MSHSHESYDIEKIINNLLTQLEDYRTLFHSTCELKKMLVEKSNDDLLEKGITERKFLLDKIMATKEYCHSVKEFLNLTDNTERVQITELIQQIQQQLTVIVSLNDEILSLMKQRIEEISKNLAKIQEGKQLVNNLSKHITSTPSLIDICG